LEETSTFDEKAVLSIDLNAELQPKFVYGEKEKCTEKTHDFSDLISPFRDYDHLVDTTYLSPFLDLMHLLTNVAQVAPQPHKMLKMLLASPDHLLTLLELTVESEAHTSIKILMLCQNLLSSGVPLDAFDDVISKVKNEKICKIL